MSKLKIRQGDWVVVCDGRKALVLENAGDEKFLNLKTREVLDHPDQKTSEMGTDAPGRSFSSVGNGRSAVEQTDWHTIEEQRFAREVADMLQKLVRERSIEALVVAAPPRTLGELRRVLHDEVKSKIVAEIDKDFTTQPLRQIEQNLANI